MNLHDDAHPHGHHVGATPAVGGAKDPVCGMMVDPQKTQYRAIHSGIDYFFCPSGCRKKFEGAPARYLAAEDRPPKPAAAGTIYTCPMHPQIRQPGPGSCPICGMALEPEVATADAGPSPERVDMERRLWIGLALAAPVVVLEMGVHIAGLHLVPPALSTFIQFALATPVVLWAGWPFFVRAAQSLRTRNLNMFTLIAMGTGVAWLYSVVATLAPSVFPSAFRGADGTVAIYFEAAAVITVLVLVGQVLELRSREQTGGAIRALLDLAPKTARRIRPDGTDEDVGLDAVAVGDRLRVRPGEKVPVDGELIEGRSAVDESMVTGESMALTKSAGAQLIGGTINQSGSFVMRADKVGGETLLASIVQMVAQAQRSRAPIQRLADQVSGWFVPSVIAVALAAFAAWSIYGPEPRLAYGLVAAVTVLIIACPCALGLATPMSIMVGVGRGAQAGVLVKNAEALERMEKVTTLVVDKTGTLTEGKPKLVAIVGTGLAAAIAIADPIKPTTPQALAALRRQGIRVVMLTGDSRATAQAVARRLGITEVEAEVLPEQKIAVVEKLRRDGQVVAMAGDGTNDAPALAAADVGIAMGTGTDVAMESAGITLLGGGLDGIVRARALSRAVMGNIRQNLFLAFVYNAIGFPLPAGVIYPVFAILVSPAM